jgi:hypothetical protein
LGHQLHKSIPGQPDHPLALGPVLEQEHGGHRVGIKALGQDQLGVDLGHAREREALRLLGGLLLGGLGHESRTGRVEGGQELVTDRTVVLHDRQHLERHRSILPLGRGRVRSFPEPAIGASRIRADGHH